MGEIKFKCWLPGIKKMSYPMSLVDLINRTKGIEGICYLQYTGLKDNTGKEIYEGDILECCWDDAAVDQNWGLDRTHTGFIEYSPNCYSLVMSHNVHSDQWCNAENIKVIGNIYENPELTK